MLIERRYVYGINEDRSSEFLSLIKEVKVNNLSKVQEIIKDNPELINHTDFVQSIIGLVKHLFTGQVKEDMTRWQIYFSQWGRICIYVTSYKCE